MIFNPLKRILNSLEKTVAAGIILISCLIIVTPLCGILFQCGCDWPWLGLDNKCNFHHPYAIEQCPWCVLIITGVLSNGISIVIGIGVSSISIEIIENQHPVKEVLIRLVIGVIVFILIAIMITGLLGLKF